MSGVSVSTMLLVLWTAVTAAFAAVMAWKTLIGLREEDVLILDSAQAKLAENQQQLVARIERLTIWAKAFGFASLGLLLALGAVWAYRGYQAFNGVTP